MKTLKMITAGGLMFAAAAGTLLADSHGEGEIGAASPIEMFACNYNEGKGPADLDEAVAAWNAWADGHGLNEYSAWTLVPYYSGPDQDFDVLWLGGSEKAASLGRAQDLWLATGSEQLQRFNDVWTCDTHANYATLQFKQPPERENPGQVVLSFSDCNMAEGVTFDDLVPSLTEWAAYREGHGSTSGMWVMFPAYGGGNEDFDFKFVASWQNLEEQGADYDQYSESGWKKADELFSGKLDCDSSRVYITSNRRTADSDDD